jgi:catechol 2,3-dioxygenase-like lactoylglutathione lyase family enzyme
MPQLRCLTIKAKEPRRLADFYRRVFEVKTVSEDDTLVRLSDGVFTLGLLKANGERRNGFDATGFRVEELAGIKEKAVRRENDAAAPYSEYRIADPDGNLIDLSRNGFGASTENSPYPIKHLALYTADPKRLSEFYQKVLHMKEVAYSDRSSIFVSDGYFNVALLYQRVGEEKNGYNHFGFHIQDIEEIRDRAEGAGVRRGAKRPDRIPYAEYRLHDPEGNGIDISVKGWKT